VAVRENNRTGGKASSRDSEPRAERAKQLVFTCALISKEERRCCGELQNDLSAINDEFPETAALLKIIESDGKRHRAEIATCWRAAIRSHLA